MDPDRAVQVGEAKFKINGDRLSFGCQEYVKIDYLLECLCAGEDGCLEKWEPVEHMVHGSKQKVEKWDSDSDSDQSDDEKDLAV